MPSKHRWFIVSVLVFLLSVSFNAYADSLVPVMALNSHEMKLPPPTDL